METDPVVVRCETATSMPSWEDNYPPKSVIKLPGRLQPSQEGYSIRRKVVTLPGGLQPSWEFNYTPGSIIVFPGGAWSEYTREMLNLLRYIENECM